MNYEFPSAQEFWSRGVAAVQEEQQRVQAAKAEVIHAIDQKLAQLNCRLNQISDDSYVTRNECHDAIRQVARFKQKIVASKGKEIDLRQKLVNNGRDPEEAYEYRMSDLEYVTEFHRNVDTYEGALSEINPIVEKLASAGITVKTGVIAIAP